MDDLTGITEHLRDLFRGQSGDALELVSSPIVEVHLSNVDGREEWRRVSVVADLVSTKIAGKGPDGYREALEFLVAKERG